MQKRLKELNKSKRLEILYNMMMLMKELLKRDFQREIRQTYQRCKDLKITKI